MATPAAREPAVRRLPAPPTGDVIDADGWEHPLLRSTPDKALPAPRPAAPPAKPKARGTRIRIARKQPPAPLPEQVAIDPALAATRAELAAARAELAALEENPKPISPEKLRRERGYGAMINQLASYNQRAWPFNLTWLSPREKLEAALLGKKPHYLGGDTFARYYPVLLADALDARRIRRRG